MPKTYKAVECVSHREDCILCQTTTSAYVLVRRDVLLVHFMGLAADSKAISEYRPVGTVCISCLDKFVAANRWWNVCARLRDWRKTRKDAQLEVKAEAAKAAAEIDFKAREAQQIAEWAAEDNEVVPVKRGDA